VRTARLPTIEGAPPILTEGRPPGCAFRPRCVNAVTRCTEQAPSVTTEGSRSYRCYVPIAREAQ
jgi:peptide/nickel transport system ATP-binding protein